MHNDLTAINEINDFKPFVFSSAIGQVLSNNPKFNKNMIQFLLPENLKILSKLLNERYASNIFNENLSFDVIIESQKNSMLSPRPESKFF